MSSFRRNRPEAAVVVRGALELCRPWIRPDAECPADAAACLVIDNKGTEQDRLLAAASPVAEAIEIRAIRVAGGEICMQALPNGLALPSGSRTELKPRGYHLLLKGVHARLEPGRRVSATLAFERAGRVDLEFVVETPGLLGDRILHEERKGG